MKQAKEGDTVKVHYTGKVGEEVFESSSDKQPLQFEIGKGEVIQGFEQAVVGMEPGASKTVKLSSEEGFGEHRDDLLVDVEREKLASVENIEPGMRLELHLKNGGIMKATVVKADEHTVLIDANHPLAGRDLEFDIKLLGIE